MIALDSSALLAFMFREEGHEVVGGRMQGACMTTVNLCEVLGRFARDGHAPGDVMARLGSTQVEWVAFEVELCEIAAGLVPRVRPLGLSLGDRACLALGIGRSIPVLTADVAWKRLDLGIEIVCIR
jgi:ribonuclease VapC